MYGEVDVLLKQIQMKKLILLTLAILMTRSALYSQFDFEIMAMQHVYYQYDEVGNRIEKSILLLKSGNAGDSIPSVSEIKDKTFSPMDVLIYPNPTEGQINIEVKSNEYIPAGDEILQVGVFDLRGRLVLKRNVNKGEMLSADLSMEPQGIYFLVLWDKEVSSQWTIVKR